MWIMCLFVSFVRNYSKESLMEAGNWKKIAKLVQEAADIVRKARGKDNLDKHLLAS